MNIFALIPFIFGLFVINVQIYDDNLITFAEVLIFFFWIGYNFFTKTYYQKCILDFYDKYGQEFADQEFDLIFKKKYDDLKLLRLDFLELANHKIPNGACELLKHAMFKKEYSNLRKFFIFFDSILPIIIFIMFFIHG